MTQHWLAASVAILATVAMPPQPQIEPWRRVEVEGYIRSEEEFQMFGGNVEKRLLLEVPIKETEYTYSEKLGFASVADYKQAEREIGGLVVVDGYLVTRGYDQWVVPISMRAKR